MLRNTTVGVFLVLASALVAFADESTTMPRAHIDGPLPATATWSARWDHQLNGEVVSESRWELKLNVRNKNITGRVSKDPGGDPSGSIFSGQLIAGTPQAAKADVTVLILREDHADGYFVINTARMVSKHRFLGTWIDSTGQDGDFEILLTE